MTSHANIITELLHYCTPLRQKNEQENTMDEEIGIAMRRRRKWNTQTKAPVVF